MGLRVIMLIAVVFLAIALVCFAVPVQVAGDGGSVWLAAGLLTWAIDVLIGGNAVVPIATRRP